MSDEMPGRVNPPPLKPDETRMNRGLLIAQTPGAIEKVNDDLFTVKSQSGPGSYRVTLAHRNGTCNCPDYIKRGLPCKHVASVLLFLERTTTLPTGEVVTEKARLTYTQSWEHYDAAQTEEIRLFDLLLRDLTCSLPETRLASPKGGRPAVPIQDQLFCAIQKVYSGLSCRRSNSLLGFATERGHLSKARHYGISSEVFNREEITPILQSLVTEAALPLAALDEGFAPDSTGVRTTSFGAWREEKHGERRENVWLKCHALVGVKTHVVVRASVTDKNGADITEFSPLLRQAVDAGFSLKEVYADKAYSSRANYNLAEELGFDLFVPFKANARGKSWSLSHVAGERGGSTIKSRLWRQAFLFFQMHREEFEAKYHQRSNVEATFSALKRKLGETLRSRNRTAQVNELLAKIVAYNITVLIHEMFEHGVTPDFLSDKSVGSLSHSPA